jgi:hypothetical protein
VGEPDIEAMRRRARHLEATKRRMLQETRGWLIACGKELSRLNQAIYESAKRRGR